MIVPVKVVDEYRYYDSAVKVVYKYKYYDSTDRPKSIQNISKKKHVDVVEGVEQGRVRVRVRDRAALRLALGLGLGLGLRVKG
jgi:hypothetical protein